MVASEIMTTPAIDELGWNDRIAGQQPAAKECAREELVLQLPHTVADHADEPQEGDTGNGYQAQGQGYGVRLLFEPDAAVGRIGRDGESDEHIGDDEQHGKKECQPQPPRAAS